MAKPPGQRAPAKGRQKKAKPKKSQKAAIRPSASLPPETLDALAFGYLAARGEMEPKISAEGVATAAEALMLAPRATALPQGLAAAPILARSRTQVANDVRDCLEPLLPNLEKRPADTWPDKRDWVRPANMVANCIGRKYAKPDQPTLATLLVAMHDKTGNAIVRALVDAITN